MERHSMLEREGDRHSPPHQEEGKGGLWRWVCFSSFLHAAIIWSFFLIPPTGSRRAIAYPVYTVELVGVEKISGVLPDSRIKPAPASKKKTKKIRKKKASAAKIVKKEKPRTQVALVKKKKTKKVKKKAPQVSLKRSKKRVKKERRAEERLPDNVREKLIQAAVDRVKRRAEALQEKRSEAKKAEPVQGPDVVAPKRVDGEGGIVKGVQFLIYRKRMLDLIKERWTWVVKRTDLELTVRFGIQENGEIVGLRIVAASEDSSYDNSVIQAVRRASPLPPPPESYLKDFMNVELTFRPEDLSG